MEIASTNVMGTAHNRSYKIADMEPGEIIKRAREDRGWSQDDLARAVRISQPAIKKIESGETQQSKFLPQIAAVLDLELNDLLPEGPKPNAQGIIPKHELITAERNFPIYASAEGGEGQIIVDTNPVDFVPRPAPLAHVRDSYGILVVGTSMEPAFRQGDTALINPHLPPMGGEPHIFFAERHGAGRATIKELRRATADKWLVKQHNPQRDFALPRSEWRWAHRVIGSYTRR